MKQDHFAVAYNIGVDSDVRQFDARVDVAKHPVFDVSVVDEALPEAVELFRRKQIIVGSVNALIALNVFYLTSRRVELVDKYP